ncbi:uncharacterized protein DEA37_0014117 [Paragonimus westermani]|uniref:Uncharacterized protein n=1 Tax=Paragonimus westermani TaxID=34504 RepID=A0A5J4P2N8_9TREM|nr:uncharacterized protein DEA37_0014117 [Paragonimus westermani]
MVPLCIPALGVTENTPVPSSSKDTKLGSDLAIYLGVTIATALVVSTIFCSIWLLIILKGSPGQPVKEETDAETEDIIYECPGLAATTKLEVTNPVFEMSLKKVRND